jgi:chitin synthase
MRLPYCPHDVHPKVIFEERMTIFAYKPLNALWRVTGVALDRYELVLGVDV